MKTPDMYFDIEVSNIHGRDLKIPRPTTMLEALASKYSSSSQPPVMAFKERSYVIHTYTFSSINDGDIITLSPGDLASCYRVRLSECVVFNPQFHTENLFRYLHPNKIWLTPRPKGDYKEHFKFLSMRIFEGLGD